MTRFPDAALLKGEYAKMMKQPPKNSEWKKAACDNKAEEVAQEVAKHIFTLSQGLDPQGLDPKTEKLEILTFSSSGPIKVMGLMPGEGDLIRIDGMFPQSGDPVSIVQHTTQLSLTFTKAAISPETGEEDAGMQIGFVIFDELSKRKKQRTAAKRKTARSRKPANKKTARK